MAREALSIKSMPKLPLHRQTFGVVCIHVMSFKEESGRYFFHFREVFIKCIKYIGKIPDSFQGDFEFLPKSGTFF